MCRSACLIIDRSNQKYNQPNTFTAPLELAPKLNHFFVTTFIKISGGDDGFLHIWDLRQLANKTPVGTFKHHTAPVTSIEWHWTEPSVLASAGEDHQVALWDLAVERDDDDVVDEELNVCCH